MVKNKSTVNFGICQGVVRASPFSPMPGIAMFDVRVKSNRKNPKTKRYEVHVLNFVAKGAVAEEARKTIHDGSIVFLSFHLEERTNVTDNGVCNFHQERVVDKIIVRSPYEYGAPGYTNHGVLQGKYIGITKIETAEGIYDLTIMLNDPLKRRPQHFSFIVYGVLGESIEKRFVKGQTVLVEYKIEKSKRTRRDGKVDHFTNLVLEKIV